MLTDPFHLSLIPSIPQILTVKDDIATQVVIAVQKGDKATVAEYLASGGDANAADGKGFSLLHWAAQEGRIGVLKMLIKGGADVNAQDRNGFSPLVQAVGENHPKAVRALLAAGADPNIRCTADSNGTPLHSAAAWNMLTMIPILLKAGADKEARDDYNRKPVQYAKLRKHATAIQLLE